MKPSKNKSLKLIKLTINHLFQDFGVKKENIFTESDSSDFSFKEKFISKQAGSHFSISIVINEIDYQIKNTSTFPAKYEFEKRWQWCFEISYQIKNPQNISIFLELENDTFKEKVKKLLGKKQDLEIFDETFDKTFILQAYPKYIHALVLNSKLQSNILHLKEGFTKLKIENNYIQYKEEFPPPLKRESKERILAFLKIFQQMAVIIDNVKLN
jgi:hypothetical protein